MTSPHAHMIGMRWHLPSPPLRRRVLVAGGASLAVVTGLAVAARTWLPLGGGYPLRAALVFGTMYALVAGLIGAHYPHPKLGPANHVTLVRAGIVALVTALLFERAAPSIAAVATAGAVLFTVLDGVDGWLARRSGLGSEFGARFDTEIDALFVMVLSVLVWEHDKAGVWVLLGGIWRYAFVAAAWVLPWMARPLAPTLRGRVTAVVHMVGLTVALAPIIPMPLSAAAAGITLAILTWSFAVDVGRLWRQT